MRPGTAVLAGLVLGLAIAAMAAPPASASAQTTIQQEVSSFPGSHASFPLDSLRSLIIQVPKPALVRLTRADSAGHNLLVLEVRAMPDPAGAPTASNPTNRNCSDAALRSAAIRTLPLVKPKSRDPALGLRATSLRSTLNTKGRRYRPTAIT